jgi:acyl-CoA thioesterase YciA
MTRETIITIDTITMVSLGADGKPKPHGKTQVEYVSDRIKS